MNRIAHSVLGLCIGSLLACSGEREVRSAATDATMIAPAPAQMDSASRALKREVRGWRLVPLLTTEHGDMFAEFLGLGRVENPALPGESETPPGFVRVGVLSHEGGCVEDTHYVCESEILLSVQQDGDASTLRHYYLGRIGELVNAAWVTTNYPGTLRLIARNYPADVLERVRTYRELRDTLELVIYEDSALVTRRP